MGGEHAHFTIRSDTAILLFQSHIFWQLCKSSRYFHQRFDIFSVMSFSPIGFAPFLLFWARSCYGCMIPVSAASCRSLFWIFLPNGNEFRFVSEPLCSYDNSLCDVCQRFCFFCPGSISVPPASIGNLKNCRFFYDNDKIPPRQPFSPNQYLRIEKARRILCDRLFFHLIFTYLFFQSIPRVYT